jgi:putative transposase
MLSTEPGHKIYPYLPRGMEITRPNQVWAMDITYIPMARGFVYLAVVLDWATRGVLSWQLSITMEAAFCVETLEAALAHHRQAGNLQHRLGLAIYRLGVHRLLASHGIAISIGAKGAWRDNVLVERLWKSIKYEEVYLHAYERFHRAVSRLLQRTQTAFELDDMTPDQAYFTPTAAPRGGLTPTEAPLIDAELLCRQPGPVHRPTEPLR